MVTAVLSMNGYSQISFEKGYYIDNSKQKTECLIKNIDWKNNPTTIEFKLSENGETFPADIKTIEEFGIYNVSKYIRNIVKIDNSSDNIERLSNEKTRFL